MSDDADPSTSIRAAGEAEENSAPADHDEGDEVANVDQGPASINLTAIYCCSSALVVQVFIFDTIVIRLKHSHLFQIA